MDCAVTARHDYQPFGEEIARASYGADTNRKQFTGYERDNESGLDFAQARYFSSGFGRFSSPDDFLKDSDIKDPQSWNKYVYVRNNPLNLIDLTGQKATVTIDTDEKNKTATITISAKFGIYIKKGSYTRAEIDAQKKNLTDQITNTYNGASYVKDGITYTIKTDIEVHEYSSEENAANDAQKGNIDNIVGLRKEASFQVDGETAIGAGYHRPGENFDRLEVATLASGASTRTYAHEFGHLLGSGTHSTGKGVFDRPNSGTTYLSAEDFDNVLGGTVSSHNWERAKQASSNLLLPPALGVNRTTQTVWAPRRWFDPSK